MIFSLETKFQPEIYVKILGEIFMGVEILQYNFQLTIVQITAMTSALTTKIHITAEFHL